nr:Galactose/methyl galactoside import ATP-binding protein MglA [Klebsiella pneumoniae]
MREPLNRFSVAMQQIVAICRAIDLSAKVLILDEPTASLDTQEVEMLFTLMRQLRDNGVSLIFVTHFLDRSMRSATASPCCATAASSAAVRPENCRRLSW